VTEALPEIKAEDARKWWVAAKPERRRFWPELSDRDVQIITAFCNTERLFAVSDVDEFRRNAQGARTSADGLLESISAIIRIWAADWPNADPPSGQWEEDLRRLKEVQTKVQWLRDEFLGPALSPGGQRRRHVLVACHLANHLVHAAAALGVKLSLTSPHPTSPTIRFVASAVEAVFGDVTTPDALAKAVRREFADLRSAARLGNAR
jgi:hypothetical protein